MRLVLSSYTGIPPQHLGFERLCAACGSREHGKPRLISSRQERVPAFSLARNKRVVAIAVCADHEVGVDLEDSAEALPATLAWCHPNERLQLSSLPADLAEAAALRLWVRREAVLKAMGLGLGDHARNLDLSGLPPHLAGWASVLPTWRLTDLDNPDGLIISVAGAGVGSVTIRRLDHQPPSQRRLDWRRAGGDVSEEGC
jgi:phosphopantetheinyl transferase